MRINTNVGKVVLLLLFFTVRGRDFTQTEERFLELRISSAIARMEGWNHPGTLVRRLNNPGALVYAKQPGAKKADQGFARFPTAEEGFDALRREIRRERERGLGPEEIIDSWTPDQTARDRYRRLFRSLGLINP